MNQEKKTVCPKKCSQKLVCCFSICSQNICFVAKKKKKTICDPLNRWWYFIELIFVCSIYEAIFTALPFHFDWFGWRFIFPSPSTHSRIKRTKKKIQSNFMRGQNVWDKCFACKWMNDAVKSYASPCQLAGTKVNGFFDPWASLILAQRLFHMHRWEAQCASISSTVYWFSLTIINYEVGVCGGGGKSWWYFCILILFSW